MYIYKNSLRFSRNSSEFLENLKEMFCKYYMHSDVNSFNIGKFILNKENSPIKIEDYTPF